MDTLKRCYTNVVTLFQMVVVELKKNLSAKKHNVLFFAIFMMMLISIFALKHMTFYFTQPVALIVSVEESAINVSKNNELSLTDEYKQIIKSKLLNTEEKGATIYLINTFMVSQGFSDRYEVGQQVILKKTSALNTTYLNSDKKIKIEYSITSLRRDYLIYTLLVIFCILAITIGGKKGFHSLLSVLLNMAFVFYIIRLYLENISIYLLVPISTAVLIFTSLTLVSGFNKKTLSAAIGTAVGSFVAIAIAYSVFYFTDYEGLNYQEMEIALKSPVELFYMQLVIGTLGAIMDIAISIASSIEEILFNSPHISWKKLLKSGLTIGNDTMGTMTNTLILAYLSGSIPLILLMLKSGINLGYILNVSLSMEILRAIVGSIGIVISIPITLIVSMIFLYPREKRVIR